MEYIPGWDCHGLPIELKAVKSKAGKTLSLPTIRSIATRFAQHTITKQLTEFKSWAILGDWKNKWSTMGISQPTSFNEIDRSYEVRQLKVFLEMVKRGITPINWI